MSNPTEIDEFPQKPRNTLSTPLGRFIERLTYKTLVFWALLVVLTSAMYFWAVAGGDHGLNNQAGKDYVECLYFSVITFTTLGYGDLAPIGVGRVVAGVEVLIGMFLTALLIGKLASERQSTLLLLIYTSDQQRRLSGFSEDLEQLTARLTGSPAADTEAVEESLALITSLQAYLMFQSHQGRLADFGNGSALRHLYRSMNAFLSAISDVLIRLKLEPRVEQALLNVAARVARLATIMEQFHKEDGSARATFGSIRLSFAKILEWDAKTVTRRRLDQVFAVVPPKPWPKHFHKSASATLGISSTLFRKCMNELIRSGRL